MTDAMSDSDVHPEVALSPRIAIVGLPSTPLQLQTSSKALFPLVAPLKALFQAWSLYRALSYRTKPAKWMLVQVSHRIGTGDFQYHTALLSACSVFVFFIWCCIS